MRTFKFRGKKLDIERRRAEHWVFGNLIKKTLFLSKEVYWAIQQDNYGTSPVDPETVGQFTGFTDTEGQELYEGDSLITISDAPRGDETDYRICWDDEYGCWAIVETRSNQHFDWLQRDNAEKFCAIEDRDMDTNTTSVSPCDILPNREVFICTRR